MGEGYESITISEVAIGLTADTINPLISGAREVAALCVLESAPIRYRIDGIDPTPTEGIPLKIGDELNLEGSDDLLKFRAIATSKESAVLKCSYSKK
jgi:hypothetical protein